MKRLTSSARQFKLPHRIQTRSKRQKQDASLEYIGIDVHKKSKPDLHINGSG